MTSITSITLQGVADSGRYGATQVGIPTSTSAAATVLKNTVSSISTDTKSQGNIISVLLNGAAGEEETDPAEIIKAIVKAQAAAEANEIILADNADVTLGDGDYNISAGNHVRIKTGNGSSSIRAFSHATIQTGDGSNKVRADSHATVTTGSGNDVIWTSSYGTISSGAGDDTIDTHNYSTISTGDGNDQVQAYRYAKVDAGAGNDRVFTGGHSEIDGGDGNDVIVTAGQSTVKGGAGDDFILVTEDLKGTLNDEYDASHAVVDGGEGNDYIQAGSYSNVTGGLGDDVIRLTGVYASTVNYAKGDGNDTIIASSDLFLNIDGYSKDDLSIEDHGQGYLTLRFKGSDETIALDIKRNAIVNMSFSDGTSVEIAGSSEFNSQERTGRLIGKGQLTAHYDANFGLGFRTEGIASWEESYAMWDQAIDSFAEQGLYLPSIK